MTKILIKSISPNPQQPRKRFNEQSQRELAQSIKEHGLIQPIVVEPADKDHYILVSGERRLRACKLLKRKYIEANIRKRSNHGGQELLLMAIIENVQREDMDPIETAKSYEALQKEFGLGPENIAWRIGKAPTVIYSALQLLKAEPEIQEMWAKHTITHEPRVVTAILGVPAGIKRVMLMKELEKRKATGKMIISACESFNQLHQANSNKNTKAIDALQKIKTNLPEWDALYQLGNVPPWPVLNDVVMKTCDRCALRSMASESVCGSCALVSALQGLMEAVNVT